VVGTYFSWRKAALGVFLLALIVRVLYFAQSRDNPLLYMPILDETYYIDMGIKIAEGQWLGENRAFFMDPLYGYVLGVIFLLFGDNLTTIRLIHIVLDAFNVILIYLLGSRVANRHTGLIAGGIYAVYSVAFFYTLLILKTTPTVTALLLFTLALIRIAEKNPSRIGWCLLGLGSGLMVYLRANFILLVPLSVLFYGLVLRPAWKKIAMQAGFLVLGLLVMLFLGAWRNYKVSGQWIWMNTQGGRLLYSANNPGNLTGRYRVPAFSRANPQEAERDFHKETERRLGRTLSPAEVSRYWTFETFRFMTREQKALAVLIFNKVRGTAGNFEIPTNHSFYQAAGFSSLARWPLPSFAFAFAFGLPGLILGIYRRKKVSWLLVPLFSVFFTILIFYTSSRLRMPAVPYLLIGAGLCISVMFRWITSRRFIKTAVLCLVIFMLGFMSLSIRPPEMSGSEKFFLAKAYWTQNRLRQAHDIASEGAARYPSQARFNVLLAMIALSDNRPGKALQYNLSALRLDPDNEDAYHNIGLAYLTMDKPAMALEHFKKALSIRSHPQFFFSMARAYDAMGDYSPAITYYRLYLEKSAPSSPFRAQAENRLSQLDRN